VNITAVKVGFDCRPTSWCSEWG